MVRVVSKAVTAALFGIFIAGTVVPVQAVLAAPTENVSLTGNPKYAAVLLDPQTGEVLYAHNPDEPRHPASITKVMTLFLTFEEIQAGRLQLTDRLSFSPYARGQAPSKLGIGARQTISIDEAIQALATKSANDVAVALAERIGGTESRFAQRMTERAQALGMKSSNFVNASGLPNPAHSTTARDIATLSQAMLQRFPQFYSYFQQQQFTWAGRVMPNHNKLLGRTPGVDGIKTGYTVASGFTLAAAANRDGKRLIAVVLGAPTSFSRDNNVEALLNAGYDVLAERREGRWLGSVAARVDVREQPLDLWRMLADQGNDDSVTAQRGAVRVSAPPPAGNARITAPFSARSSK